ncbi:CoA transferase [Desulfosarcina sp. OttesenSCG-928-G10]|nr:CoA transferase [Desulfosarcina sp. OttesenSCG-928-G10]MDL2320914.1 CoA transferase [Desulfosarcina sp. OttesenSCG-928-B08]
MQALSGLKILDFTLNMPGPYMTRLLTLLGADVLKIENPGSPDPSREGWDQTPGVPNPLFDLLNRGKKGCTLNLKTPEAREIVIRLLEKYDILVEGFRPGVMERLGLDYKTLSPLYPRLIYVSISGFGQTGSSRLAPAHDLNCQALAGCFDGTVNAGKTPQMPNVAIADQMGGSFFGILGLLSAVVQRGETGKGQYVDVSMTHGALAVNVSGIVRAMTGAAERKTQDLLQGAQPHYNIYETLDHRHIALAAIEPKFWKNFCTTIGREDLIPLHSGGEPVVRTVAEIFRSRSQDDWCRMFEGVDACVAPVRTVAQALDSDTIRSRAAALADGYDTITPMFPLCLSASPVNDDTPAPCPGEHNENVLTELGFSENSIAALKARGVI